jgi:hypothetical protein
MVDRIQTPKEQYGIDRKMGALPAHLIVASMEGEAASGVDPETARLEAHIEAIGHFPWSGIGYVRRQRLLAVAGDVFKQLTDMESAHSEQGGPV